MFDAAANSGAGAAVIVITLDTGANARPHASVAVHVCVTVPPHAPGIVEYVERFDVPLIKQSPVNPFVNESVLAAGNWPHATVIAAGAVIVGNAAGLTVITLDLVIVLLHASVYVHDSVTVPPHAPGIAPSVDITEPLIKHAPLPPLV